MTEHERFLQRILTPRLTAMADSIVASLRESEALHPLRTVDEARVDLGDADEIEGAS